MKYRKLFAAALAMLMLAGCAENPDSGIVVHKDMEKVISEAENSGEGRVGLSEMRGNTVTHYEKDLFSSPLNIAANVKADVEIPAVERASVFRVQQRRFTQAEVDRVRALLMGDDALIDMAAYQKRTRSEIEAEIAGERAALAEASAEMQQEIQRRIDRLEAEYEAAPDEQLSLPSDGRLRSVAAEYAQEPSDFWSYYNQQDPSGELLWVENAAHTAGLYVQNNKNLSSKIEFSASPVGSQMGADPYVQTFYSLDFVRPHYFADEMRVIPENFVYRGRVFDETLRQIDGDSCTLSQADAEQQAADMLHEIGEDSFGLYEGGLHTELLLDMQDERNLKYFYRTCYILRYCRMTDGIMLKQHSGMKSAEDDESYTKRFWPEEMIEFTVDDHGIVGFRWCAPLEITEIVVDNAAMKPFDEIRRTFEKFVLMTNAYGHEESGTFTPVRVRIDSISLSYSRISEKDSFDTGLIVPVWGFTGKRAVLTSDSVLKEQAALTGQQAFEYEANQESGALLAINAIDGSVIDPVLGY